MGIFDAPQSNAPLVPFLVVTSALAPIPFVNMLARPGGFVSRTLTPLLFSSSSDLQRLAALSGIYLFVVYNFSAGLCLMGAALGNPEGYRNAEPRLVKPTLKGFAHRLTALHDNLLEIFPAYIICALITLALPLYGADRELIDKSLNFLVMHVFLKTCVYVPAYAANYDTVRSAAHLFAIASLLGLLIGVARG